MADENEVNTEQIDDPNRDLTIPESNKLPADDPKSVARQESRREKLGDTKYEADQVVVGKQKAEFEERQARLKEEAAAATNAEGATEIPEADRATPSASSEALAAENATNANASNADAAAKPAAQPMGSGDGTSDASSAPAGSDAGGAPTSSGASTSGTSSGSTGGTGSI